MEAITKTNIKKITSIYKIEGMTCSSCVEKITQRLKAIPGISWVNVSLSEKKADIISDRMITLNEVKVAIADLPKYKADFYDDVETSSSMTETKSFYQTYKPLLVVFAYILIFSVAYQIHLGSFSAHMFMNHLMAGFFIGLSFFKFLDLKSFATAFANYDPLAKKWKSYGAIYPFIELTLGFLFIADKFLLFANTMTILVLTTTTVGVYQKIKSKSQFQCACLGAGFNIPLSNITIFENLAMVVMGSIGIFAPL
ncbi:hypothetical protein CIK05_10980 [Bdellovibrio sp. qaytius]|nr:hypothetical protein CIK05_10980 [Bdellovibrio sp. qaytius]